jgi:uncharacterized membrane protein YbhN (UPF0104 family)
LLGVAKVAVSATLLYFAFRRVDLSTVIERLPSVDRFWLAAAFLSLVAQVVVVGLRWSLVTSQCGWRLSRSHAIRYAFIGTFFNQTLPSTVGGDAFRIWYLARDGSGWAIATYSILIDRAVGMLALALLVVTCLPWTLALISDPVGRAILFAVAFTSIAAVVAFLALSMLGRWRDRLRLIRHLIEPATIARNMLLSWRNGRTIAAYSVLSCLLSIVAWWCAARAIAAPFGLTEALLLVPPLSLIATVPISIAGWGVRENVVMAACAYVGISAQDGLLMSVLLGFCTFAAGLPGGALWTVQPSLRSLPNRPTEPTTHVAEQNEGGYRDGT